MTQKEALDFIIENPNYLSPISVSKIEDIHGILVRELAVERNLRKRRVGISGTNNKPLDNEIQIHEALVNVMLLIRKLMLYPTATIPLRIISKTKQTSTKRNFNYWQRKYHPQFRISRFSKFR